jgi:hypothetical protein
VRRSHLTKEEQEHVREVLRFLRIRFGNTILLAKGLRMKSDTLYPVMTGKESVSAALVIRVARLAQVGIDDLLAGRYPVKGTCPHCGRGPV